MDIQFELSNHTKEEIEEKLKTRMEETASQEEAHLKQLTTQKETAGVSLNKLEDALDKRQEINKKHEARYRELEDTLLKTKEKWQASHQKEIELKAKTTTERSHMRSIVCKQDVSEKNFSDAKDNLKSNIHTHLANSLNAVSTLIDTSNRVTWSTREFSWYTKEIKIQDRDGVPLPFNFGSFFVSLELDSGRLIAKITSTENLCVEGYCHPHIPADGAPCLGTASSFLLRDLEGGNIAHAIVLVDKFLCSYNPLDPYLSLDHFVPTKYHTALCECKLDVITNCGCDRCSSCGVLINHSEDEVENLNASEVLTHQASQYNCNCCIPCCHSYHSQVADGNGINGSACCFHIK